MDADDFLVRMRKRYPHSRFALSQDGSKLGQWISRLGYFVPIASRNKNGQWARLGRTEFRACYRSISSADRWRE